MGSGLGSAQRAVVEIFEAEPDARLTVKEIAGRVYGLPGNNISRSHTNNIGRVLRQLGPVLGIASCRVSDRRRFGWRHVWGRN